MKLLALCLLTSSLLACTAVKSVVCSDIEQTAVNYVSQNVLMNLCTCSSAAQVEAFVLSKIPASIQSAICPVSGKLAGPIGSVVCAPLINAVASIGCTQIPSCTGPNPNGSQLAALITKCQGAF